MEREIEELCNELRQQLKIQTKAVKNLMDHSRFDTPPKFTHQHSEMKANIMLAARHLEDSRMRIGKVLQYADNGISHYDQ